MLALASLQNKLQKYPSDGGMESRWENMPKSGPIPTSLFTRLGCRKNFEPMMGRGFLSVNDYKEFKYPLIV